MSKFPMTVVALMALATTGTLEAPGLHAQEPTPPQDHAADSVVAEIAQAHEDSLTVRTEDGVHMTFVIEEDTRVIDPTGQVAEVDPKDRIAALDPGARVVVHFQEGDTPQERVATAIEIRTGDTEQMRQRDEEQREQARLQQEREREREQARLQQEREREQARLRQEREREREQARLQQEREQLPATGGNLPLVALLGMLGVMAGSGMVFWARREN